MYVQVQGMGFMAKFQEDVRKLLTYIGGKENIQAVSHCVTRMRFVLKDPALADIAEIEALPSAKGTFTQSGQFQVIIGNEVSEFYNEFTAYAGIDGVSKDTLKSLRNQSDCSSAYDGSPWRNFCPSDSRSDLRRSDIGLP